MATLSVQGDLLRSLRGLDDDALVAQTRSLLAGQRMSLASLIAHVAELGTRDVYLRAGFGSLFAYCRDGLALSESEAYHWTYVARAVRRFPAILDLLAEGAANLTTVRLLAPYLTVENHRQVLESARGKRKVEVEEIMVRLAPRPEVPDSVRRLPGPRPVMPTAEDWRTAPSASFAPSRAPLPPAYVPAIAPLAPSLYRLQVTIDGTLLEKLRLAKDMLRHVIPAGTDSAILERALTTLLAELARQKFAAVESPRAPAGTAPGSRHVPAEVKRGVWLRDLGRCAYQAPGGRRCEERGFLEFHHVKPYAVGGEATIGNIQLRCRAHNQYEARICFDRAEDGAS